MNNNWQNWDIPTELKICLAECKNIIIPKTREELIELSMGGPDVKNTEVGFVADKLGYIAEADIVRCKNGIAVNYKDPYIRRRDPDCMLVNNISKTDKTCFEDAMGYDFASLRNETFDWLKSNDLIVLPFKAGGNEHGYPALFVGPRNAGFFAASLYDLQGHLDLEDLDESFSPKAIIYLAPSFRHSHFNGKQAVVHNNSKDIHEIFSYNLYPGPSAKKGVYGVLLAIGLKEGWITVHGSTVKVLTPYDNEIIFLHEGASGSGKSEMLENAKRSGDGRLKLGKNLITGDRKYVSLSQSCKLYPVTDDMALCHPSFQTDSGKLVVKDAEEGWFIRVNHIDRYGIEPALENLTIHPKKPLIFFNIQASADATCLIWEHTEDSPGKACPNPRVIIPRNTVKGIQNEPMEVDYRSFGLRTPPCLKEAPSYGILGVMHILPPALAWLWRLVAPRGYANPSIVADDELASEGVGSYWPFATGRKVDHANLLLEQIVNTPKTRHMLIPNQHMGAWEVGFMSQWISREYLARRGKTAFGQDKLKSARCVLAGYTVKDMLFEGSVIPNKFLEVNLQPEVGNDAYDKGAEMLYEFFDKELRTYLEPDLSPLGRKIIECCLERKSIEDYERLINFNY